MKTGQRLQETWIHLIIREKQNQIANSIIYCHAFYVLIILMFMYIMCGSQLDISSH